VQLKASKNQKAVARNLYPIKLHAFYPKKVGFMGQNITALMRDGQAKKSKGKLTYKRKSQS